MGRVRHRPLRLPDRARRVRVPGGRRGRRRRDVRPAHAGRPRHAPRGGARGSLPPRVGDVRERLRPRAARARHARRHRRRCSDRVRLRLRGAVRGRWHGVPAGSDRHPPATVANTRGADDGERHRDDDRGPGHVRRPGACGPRARRLRHGGDARRHGRRVALVGAARAADQGDAARARRRWSSAVPGVSLRRVQRDLAVARPPPADGSALRPGVDRRLYQRAHSRHRARAARDR